MILGYFLGTAGSFLVQFLVQFVYPTVETYKVLNCPIEGGDKGLTSKYDQWVMYWMIVVVWELCVEKFLDSLFSMFFSDFDVVGSFPFFLELKVGFLLWLILPTYNGGAFLWQLLCGQYKEFDKKYYQLIVETIENFKIPKPNQVVHKLNEIQKQIDPEGAKISQTAKSATTATLKPPQKSEPPKGSTASQKSEPPKASTASSTAVTSNASTPWWLEKALTKDKVKQMAKGKQCGEQQVDEWCGKTIKALKDLGKAKGLTQELIDACDEVDDTLLAFVAFLVEKENAADEGGRLQEMNIRELKKKAANVGASEAEIEATEEVDETKGALIELIITKQVQEQKMNLKQLKTLAQSKGASKEEISETDEAEDTKLALIKLIAAKS